MSKLIDYNQPWPISNPNAFFNTKNYYLDILATAVTLQLEVF